MRTKRAIIGAGCTLLLGGAAWLLWPSPSEPPKADWQRWLDDRVPPHVDSELDARIDMKRDIAVIRELRNDLLRRDTWRESEVDRVRKIIDRWPNNAVTTDDTSDHKWREFFTSRMAMSAIDSRISANAPITEEAFEQIIGIYLERSTAADPHIRHGMVPNMVHPRVLSDPRIRARVREMQRDPDPMVAANAKRQLFFAEQDERLLRERARDGQP